ncbi:MAG: hypothetical protein ABJ327_17905 [Litoreibacter sp.]
MSKADIPWSKPRLAVRYEDPNPGKTKEQNEKAKEGVGTVVKDGEIPIPKQQGQ